MAKVTVKYSCGCGFSATTLEEAIQHSDEEHHTLTAVGEVKSEESGATIGSLSSEISTLRDKLRARK